MDLHGKTTPWAEKGRTVAMEKDCGGFQSRGRNRNLVKGENEGKFKQAEIMHLYEDHCRGL